MEPSHSPEPEELQFQKAEVAEGEASPLSCHRCQRSLHDVYFEVNGQPSCEKCRYEAESERASGSGAGRFARAVAGGSAGALVGAGVYYAVLALTGYEVGLVAIVVGFLVGAGVRWGARGRGGWAYQTLAVSLTYLAIVGTYVPLVFQQLEEMEATETQPADQGSEGVPDTPSPGAGQVVAEPPVEPAGAMDSGEEVLDERMAAPEITGAEALMALGLFALFVLALPFLGGLENFMGIIIIGIGLYQAWAMNKWQPLSIEGPFQIGESRPSSPPGSLIPQ